MRRRRRRVDFSGKRIHAQRQVNAVLLNHPDGQNDERARRLSQALHFGESNLRKLKHGAPPYAWNNEGLECWVLHPRPPSLNHSRTPFLLLTPSPNTSVLSYQTFP